jgi:hypothetical protein
MNTRIRAPMIAAVVLIAQGCAFNTPPAPARESMKSATPQLPAWLTGLWLREWIERRGTRTNAFEVHYLQTPSAFADVRIPRERTALAHAASFADLTDSELLLLARQRAFAGNATVEGDIATWHREIDFQPSDSSPDIGRLERIGDARMLEHALDSSYVESWRSGDDSRGRFLALRMQRNGRLERVLVVAGDHFIYVRNRERDLPGAESLESLIASTKASRAQIIAYLDCEFSVGRVRGGPVRWNIERSTIPWREGRALELADSLISHGDSLSLVAPDTRGVTLSVPVNTFASDELDAMFARRR